MAVESADRYSTMSSRQYHVAMLRQLNEDSRYFTGKPLATLLREIRNGAFVTNAIGDLSIGFEALMARSAPEVGTAEQRRVAMHHPDLRI